MEESRSSAEFFNANPSKPKPTIVSEPEILEQPNIGTTRIKVDEGIQIFCRVFYEPCSVSLFYFTLHYNVNISLCGNHLTFVNLCCTDLYSLQSQKKYRNDVLNYKVPVNSLTYHYEDIGDTWKNSFWLNMYKN